LTGKSGYHWMQTEKTGLERRIVSSWIKIECHDGYEWNDKKLMEISNVTY